MAAVTLADAAATGRNAAALPRAAWWWRSAVTGAGVGRRLVRPPRSFRLGRFAEVASGGTEVAGRLVFRDVPRLSHYTVGPTGWTARVKLRPGQQPETLDAAREALRHAFRAGAVTFRPDVRPGYLRMIVQRVDPLLRLPAGEPHDVAGDGTRLVLGAGDDGDPFALDFRALAHWLLTGATGAGKSTIMHAIFVAAARTDAAVVAADLKFGLEQAGWLPRLTDLATDQGEAVEVFARLLDLVARRARVCRDAGVSSVWALPPGHACRRFVLVLVDELAELLLLDPAAKERGKALSTSLLRTVQLARALGVSVVFAGQRFGSDLGPTATAIRAQLAGRVVARVVDPESARMSLGDGAPGAVEAALGISEETPGVAVLAAPTGWRRVRGVYVTAEYAAAVARQTAGLRATWDDLALPGVRPLDLPEVA